MSLVQRALTALARAQTARPRLFVAAALLLAAFSVVYTVTGLGFQTSQRDLISPDNRLVRLSHQLDRFGDLDSFAVVIEAPNPDRALAFLRRLTPRLETDREHYQQIFYRIDPAHFRRWALLYLKKSELLDIRQGLQKHREILDDLARSPSLTTFFGAVNREMASKMVGELFTGFLSEEKPGGAKPLDLGFLIRTLGELRRSLDGEGGFASPWGSFFGKGGWTDSDDEGYFWTEGKRYLLCLVTPVEGGDGFANTEGSLTALRRQIAEVRRDLPDVRAGVTGQEALNADEMGAALSDMSLATGLSLAGLILLLVAFWRGVRRPLLEITELVLALCWTFGLTTGVIGHLNILSVTFAPLLLGLGIDYGIHWFSRYQEEEEARGASREEALVTTMVQLGPSILLAGATAALSFFPLVLTGFKGLVELGLITSMGMLATTVTTLCVLPSLALLFDRPHHRRSAAVPDRTIRAWRLSSRTALAVLVPSAAVLAASLWAAGSVRFDLNMLHLQDPRAESVVWEHKLLEGSDRSSLYGAVLTHSLEELGRKVRALKALPTVADVQTVRSFLPEDQEEKIGILRPLEPLLPEARVLERPGGPVDLAALDQLLGRIRFKMLDASDSQWGPDKPLRAQMVQVRDEIDQVRRRLGAMDRPRAVAALGRFQHLLFADLADKVDLLRTDARATPMVLADLPRELLDRYVGPGPLYLIRVYSTLDIWEPTLLGRFVRDLRTVDPDAIGDPVTLYVFTQAFRNACVKAAVYAVIFIFGVLWLTLRRLGHTLLAMTPLVVGTAWTLGLMRLVGIHFNLANSLFLPLVVGAGVEYGIVVVQRWRQLGSGVLGMALPWSTVKGIVLAGLTTTVGFGSLTISGHRGIHSLGLLAVVGSLSILAAAVLFLPALLQVLAGPRGEEEPCRARNDPIPGWEETGGSPGEETR